MNDLAIFEFEGTACRTLTVENQPWWVGKEVCTVLGYKDTVNALKLHCRGVAKYHPIVDRLGRTQEVRIINEPDVYRLIGGSKLPAAQRFEAWLYETVLPQICRTGRYAPESAPQQDYKHLNTLLTRCEKSIGYLLEKNSRLACENRLYRENESLRKKLAQKNTPLSESKKKAICDMGQNLSVNAIAAMLSRSPTTVRRFLKKENAV